MRKHSRADAHEGHLPEYLRDYHRRREEEPVNFEELRSALAKLATWTEPISIPSDEEREAMLVRRAVKAEWEHQALFWALRGYPGSEDYRKQIEELNRDIKASGLWDFASGEAVAEDSLVAVAIRAINKESASAALFDVWAQLQQLAGRRIELMQLQKSAEKTLERDLKSGAPSSSLAQHVWYARWVLARAGDFERDRPEIDDEFISLCDDVAKGRRASPDENRWPPSWFEKLLQKHKRTKLVTIGENRAELIERLSRRQEPFLRGLARKPLIADDYLPPLDPEKFPTRSNHP